MAPFGYERWINEATLGYYDVMMDKTSSQKWNQLASEESIANAKVALSANGFEVEVVENGQKAKEKVLELLPKGAEVMTMSSVTLETIGLTHEINESPDFDAVKKKLLSMDRATQGHEMKKLGAAPDWAVGSVNALTEDGKVIVASNTGSQLGAYVYAASHVIWVVGTQKIARDLDNGMKRIYEYVLPLESERVKKAYGMPSSFVSKLLIINRETVAGRIKIILVKENLGF